MGNPLIVSLVIAVAYLLGSIPFGFLLTKLAGHGDIRAIGSGNIGATNVLRTGNKKIAALTLLFDGLKGAAAVLIAQRFFPPLAAYAGLAAVLGHLFPVWLKFRGGKGVITAIGVITALAWPVGVGMMIVWLIAARLSGYSSLAALVMTGLMPIGIYAAGRDDLLPLAFAIALLVFGKHKSNIERLMAGSEPKIGKCENGCKNEPPPS